MHSTLSNELLALKEETGWTWKQIAAQMSSAMPGTAPSGSTLFRYAKGYTSPAGEMEESLLDAIARIQSPEATSGTNGHAGNGIAVAEEEAPSLNGAGAEAECDEFSGQASGAPVAELDAASPEKFSDEEPASLAPETPIAELDVAGLDENITGEESAAYAEEAPAAEIGVDSQDEKNLAVRLSGELIQLRVDTGWTWKQIAAQVSAAMLAGTAPSGSTLFRYAKGYTKPTPEVASDVLEALQRLRSADLQATEEIAAPESSQLIQEMGEPEMAAPPAIEEPVMEPISEIEELSATEETSAPQELEEPEAAAISEIEEFSATEETSAPQELDESEVEAISEIEELSVTEETSFHPALEEPEAAAIISEIEEFSATEEIDGPGIEAVSEIGTAQPSEAVSAPEEIEELAAPAVSAIGSLEAAEEPESPIEPEPARARPSIEAAVLSLEEPEFLIEELDELTDEESIADDAFSEIDEAYAALLEIQEPLFEPLASEEQELDGALEPGAAASTSQSAVATAEAEGAKEAGAAPDFDVEEMLAALPSAKQRSIAARAEEVRAQQKSSYEPDHDELVLFCRSRDILIPIPKEPQR